MTEWRPDDLKRAWTRRFMKSGGNGVHTRLFDDHNTAVRNRLLAATPISSDEVPVFASFESETYSVLITTRRVVSISDGLSSALAVGSVRAISVDFEAMRAARKTLLDWGELRFETLTGEFRSVRLEPGHPLSGVWNALGFIPGRPRHAAILSQSTASAESPSPRRAGRGLG